MPETEPVRRIGDRVRLAGADQGELCEELRRLDHEAPIRSVSTELNEPIGAELMTVLAGMTSLNELWVKADNLQGVADARTTPPTIDGGALATSLEGVVAVDTLFAAPFAALHTFVYWGSLPTPADIGALARLPALRSVRLHLRRQAGVLFPIIDPRTDFALLTQLSIEGAVVPTRSLAALLQLRNLESVRIADMFPGTLSDAAALAGDDAWPALVELDLPHSALATADLDSLVESPVRRLRIISRALPPAALGAVQQMELEHLSVHAEDLTDDEVARLDGHPTLRSVRLTAQSLTDRSLDTLRSLGQLEQLEFMPRRYESMIPGGRRRIVDLPFSDAAVQRFLERHHGLSDVFVPASSRRRASFRQDSQDSLDGLRSSKSAVVVRNVRGRTGSLPAAVASGRRVELLWAEPCPDGELHFEGDPSEWRVGDVQLGEMIAWLEALAADVQPYLRPVLVDVTLVLLSPTLEQRLAARDSAEWRDGRFRVNPPHGPVSVRVGPPSGVGYHGSASSVRTPADVAARLKEVIAAFDLEPQFDPFP